MGVDPGSAPVYSNIVLLKSGAPSKQLFVAVTPNPLTGKGNISITAPVSGNYQWKIVNIQGKVIKTGNGSFAFPGSISFPVELNNYPAGMYYLQVSQGDNRYTASFIKQ
jgi:hypothetical protein